MTFSFYLDAVRYCRENGLSTEAIERVDFHTVVVHIPKKRKKQ